MFGFFWDRERGQTAVSSSVAVEDETPSGPVVEEREEVQVPDFGAKVGRLTQFGSVWINLERVECIDLAPVDGCGAEVSFHSGETMHLSDSDSTALQAYLQMATVEPRLEPHGSGN